MPDLSLLTPAFDWIESHEKTVDLLKWGVLLLIAWAAGLFKYLRQKLRQPIAKIEVGTSRCLVEEFTEFQGHKNCIRASFILEVGLSNPTSEVVAIRHFSLAIKRRKFWRPWRPELIALSLPARPRHQTGSGEKVLKVWFSNFQDDFRELTLDGVIEPKRHHSGFLLFVCFAQGTWTPRIQDGHILVKALVYLTTGETRVAKGRVAVTRDKDAFEQSNPGILAHVSHSSAWGAVR